MNQVGGEATTLGDQLTGLVSEMSEAVGVSNEGLSDDAALCAAQKAKVLGQDLRCRALALARGARWDRPPNEAACSERRLARILDALLGRPRDGEIQASFDFDHRLAQLSALMCQERGSKGVFIHGHWIGPRVTVTAFEFFSYQKVVSSARDARTAPKISVIIMTCETKGHTT